MKIKYCYLAGLMIISVQVSWAQMPERKSMPKTQNHMSVQIEKLSNAVVKSAIEALQKGDMKAWRHSFVPNAELYDDGNKRDFDAFSKDAIGHERFVSIDKVENKGLDIYGKFHSDKWGDFKTYFKFHINTDGKVTKLEIGQASY